MHGASCASRSSTCRDAPPRRPWPTRARVSFRRRKATGQRGIPTRDLPDLLRKVPAALRAVLSAARGTERWAGVPAASPGVTQEARNRHSGGPPGSLGRGCAGGLDGQPGARCGGRLALSGRRWTGGQGLEKTVFLLSPGSALDSGQPLLES